VHSRAGIEPDQQNTVFVRFDDRAQFLQKIAPLGGGEKTLVRRLLSACCMSLDELQRGPKPLWKSDVVGGDVKVAVVHGILLPRP
jgi:hypothetical protein